MDLRRQRPTSHFRDAGQPTVESVYGDNWQYRNPMDFVTARGSNLPGTDVTDFVPNWNFNALRRSLQPQLPPLRPAPPNPFTPYVPASSQLKQMGPPKTPPQPITLPPEAFRDPNQFVTPIPPPQVPPPMPLSPQSQEIDIPEIRNQAPQLPDSINTGIPGVTFSPGSSKPIRGRYRF